MTCTVFEQLNGFGGASGWSTVPNAQGTTYAGDAPGWPNLRVLHVGAATRTHSTGHSLTPSYVDAFVLDALTRNANVEDLDGTVLLVIVWAIRLTLTSCFVDSHRVRDKRGAPVGNTLDVAREVEVPPSCQDGVRQ